MRRFWAGVVVGAFLPILVLFAVARLGLLPVAATSRPPDWERSVAEGSVRAALARRSPPDQKNPLPATDETLIAGLRIYRNNCAGCHGDFGRPSHWGTHGFYPRVPQFSDEPPMLPQGHLFAAVKHGIRYSGMGAWDGMMSDEDIWRVVAFLHSIRSLPPRVETMWKGSGARE